MESFLNALRRSGLIEESKLDALLTEFWEAPGRIATDPPILFAAFLIGSEELTCWQSAKLLAGRFKGFFLGDFRLIDHVGCDSQRSYYLARTADGRRALLGVLPPGANYEIVTYIDGSEPNANGP